MFFVSRRFLNYRQLQYGAPDAAAMLLNCNAEITYLSKYESIR